MPVAWDGSVSAAPGAGVAAGEQARGLQDVQFDREFVNLRGQGAVLAGQGLDGRLRAVREIVQCPLMGAHLRSLVLDRADRLLLPPPGAHQALAGVGGLPLGILQPPKDLIELLQSCRQLGDKIATDRVCRLGHRIASRMSRMSRSTSQVMVWMRRGASSSPLTPALCLRTDCNRTLPLACGWDGS